MLCLICALRLCFDISTIDLVTENVERTRNEIAREQQCGGLRSVFKKPGLPGDFTCKSKVICVFFSFASPGSISDWLTEKNLKTIVTPSQTFSRCSGQPHVFVKT